MPNETVRRGLSEVAASLRAYLEWQAETGAWGIPRGSVPPVAGSAEGSSPVRPSPAQAAGPKGPIPASAVSSVAPPPPAPAPHAPVAPASAVSSAAPAPALPPQPTWDAPRAPVVTAPAGGEPAKAPSRTVAELPILQSQVASCTRCELSATRTNTVFARGNPESSLCFVGEAPGADEDAQGLPFVGRAGQLLDRMIAAMGLSPQTDVYICNIIKCRPPENRRPTPEEIDTCIPYLHEQLAAVKPKVIVAMGNTAVSALLSTKLGITKVRGQWKLYRGQTLVMPTYHPSYLIRPSAQQQEAKKQAWEDLQAVMKELKLPMPKR
jgi:uracil-DNA glycosylase family 4